MFAVSTSRGRRCRRKEKRHLISCFCFQSLILSEHDFLHLFLAVSSGPILGLYSELVAEVSLLFVYTKPWYGATQPVLGRFLRCRWSFRACVRIPSLLPHGFESGGTGFRERPYIGRWFLSASWRLDLGAVWLRGCRDVRQPRPVSGRGVSHQIYSVCHRCCHRGKLFKFYMFHDLDLVV